MYDYLKTLKQTKKEREAANEDHHTLDVKYLRAVSIMRCRIIGVHETYHYKMLASGKHDRAYFESLHEACQLFEDYLKYYLALKQSGERTLPADFDITPKEKHATCKYYLGVIYQHKHYAKHNYNLALSHLCDIAHVVDRVEVKQNTIEEIDAQLMRKLVDQVRFDELDTFPYREFGQADFVFYFLVALVRSRIYKDNRMWLPKLKSLLKEEKRGAARVPFIHFYSGLVLYKSGEYKNALDFFDKCETVVSIAAFYSHCCVYQDVDCSAYKELFATFKGNEQGLG